MPSSYLLHPPSRSLLHSRLSISNPVTHVHSIPYPPLTLQALSLCLPMPIRGHLRKPSALLSSLLPPSSSSSSTSTASVFFFPLSTTFGFCLAAAPRFCV